MGKCKRKPMQAKVSERIFMESVVKTCIEGNDKEEVIAEEGNFIIRRRDIHTILDPSQDVDPTIPLAERPLPWLNDMVSPQLSIDK